MKTLTEIILEEQEKEGLVTEQSQDEIMETAGLFPEEIER